jgi:hypothetical protein
MPGRRGHQKGPQLHAEGAHGRVTHRRHIELLEGETQKESADDRRARERRDSHEGKRRLAQSRQQHDEAEKGSEITKGG